ncbi:MAG: tetratricopeptide repeat protein [Roseicyclus sp.]
MAGSTFRLTSACVALGLCCMLTAPITASAQSADLETQRQAVFTRLFASPADPDLMLQYARLSVQLRDFEAAAATLERYVDLYPADAGARLELAIAYFSLGAYEVAEYHLAAVQASGGLSPDQAARVADYQGEADARGGPNQFSGHVAIGRAWTDEADDSGTFGSARLEWRFDMGGRNADEWVTEFAYSSYMPGEFSFNGRQVARLRTGPEFRLTGDAYGPRLQPYVEAETFRDDSFGFGDYNSLAFGIAYQNPHNAYWTSFADFQVGRAEVLISDAEFDFRDASLGLSYRPSRETRLRGSLRWRDEQSPGLDVRTRGVRVEAAHMFDLGQAEMLPRQWEVGGFFDSSRTEEDFGFFTDEFTEVAFGGSLRAFVTDHVFIEARATDMERDTGGFTQRERVYALQIGWEF